MRSPKRQGWTRDALATDVTPRTIAALFAGLLAAILAFSQVAASTGLVIATFRPLGGGFFSWRSGQNHLAQSLYENRRKVDAQLLLKTGRTGLGYAPLSARSLWMVGKGYEAQSDMPRARRAMVRAEGITRREAAVQMWLAEDALRRESIASALLHYDLLMRSTPQASAEIMPRLAGIMVAPLGRKYLQPYVRPNNPWFPALLGVAVEKLPRAEPVGRLLVESKAKAPNLLALEPVYAQLVNRLVNEGSHDVALRLYPLLPNGNADALKNVGGTINGKPLVGYPPFVWSLAADAYGASFVGVGAGQAGMEFYGASGTIGIAASKLIAPRGATALRWRVQERTPNLQNSATWVATCLSGSAKGASRTSVNLMDKAVATGKNLIMPIPADCDVMRLDLRIAGGIGTNPASLIVSDLRLVNAASAG